MTTGVSPAAVRAYVIDYLRPRAERLGAGDVETLVAGDGNLLETGLLDSLGFIELIAMTEDHFGVRLDLGDADMTHLTTMDGFVRTVLESERAL